MNVLEINLSGEVTAQSLFPDAKITTVKYHPESIKACVGREYDIVLAHQCMQYISREVLLTIPALLTSLVKDGGEVWVTVPCAEYAGIKIVKGEPDPIAQYIMYGNDDEPARHAMFTLVWLRQLMEENSNLITRKATQGGIEMTFNDKDVSVPQNVWIGFRYDAGIPDPAAAIS